MSKYENIIPFLQKEYEELNSEEMSESISLDEDKIPKPLLQAYNREWYDNGTNMSRDIVSRYGRAKQVPNHSAIANNRGRRNFSWDLGKAKFTKLSKEEAADLLGLKIFSGKRKDELREISINDPIPEEVTIKLEGNLAKDNINKLRFLIKEGEDDWRLTEFEYREEVGENGKVKQQFFPIYRDYFNSSKFADAGIGFRNSETGSARFKDLLNWNSIKAVYYAIKVSDLIYETDEYEHAIDFKLDDSSLMTSFIIAYNQANQEKIIKGCLAISCINKYINEFCKKFELNKTKWVEDASLMDAITDMLISDVNITLNTSGEELLSILEDTTDEFFFARVTGRSTSVFADNILESLSSVLSPEQLTAFNSSTKNLIDSDVKQIENTDVSNILYDLQDAILDTLPEGRYKNIWVKRIKNNRLHTIAKNKGNEHPPVDGVNFRPYDSYMDDYAEYRAKDIPDTGYHRNEYNSLSDFVTSNNFISTLLNKYNSLLQQKSVRKKKYITAYNQYMQLKNEAKYFDSTDSYEDDLQEAKNAYITAKANYVGGVNADGEKCKGILNEIKQYKKYFSSHLDQDAAKHSLLIKNHLAYLQAQYQKLLQLRNLVKDISAYTEDDLVKLYGFASKKEFDELTAKINKAIESKENVINTINEYKDRIKKLQEELEELTNKLYQEETNEGDLSKEIAELEKQRSSLSTGMASVIKQSYRDQAEFNKAANELDKEIRQHRYQDRKAAAKLADMNNKQKDADTRLLQLIKEFGNGNKDLDIEAEDEPSADDILSDDDESITTDNTNNDGQIASQTA